MNKKFSKLIVTVFIALTALLVTGLAAMAAGSVFPIDTSSSGANSFENIPVGEVPTLDNETDAYRLFDHGNQGTSGFKISKELGSRNHYLEIWADGTNKKQAMLKLAGDSFNDNYGLLEFETDVKFVNSDCKHYIIGNLENRDATAGYYQNMYLACFTTHSKVYTQYTNTAGGVAKITLMDSYETGVWYHISAIYNPYTGYYKVSVLKDGDTNAFTAEVTDAKVVPKGATLSLLNFQIKLHSSYITEGTTPKIQIDNFKFKSTPAIAIDKATPSSGEAVTPSAELALGFNVEPAALSVKLNGSDITLTANSDGTYTYVPSVPLVWGDSYTLTGEATDKFGEKCSINIPFSVMTQPDNLIEYGKFVDAGGNELTALSSGEVTAKLRFWPKSEQTYTYFIALYEKDGDRMKMKDIKCAQGTFSAMTDKEITINVPDAENYFVKVFVCDTLLSRKLFSGSEVYGQMILE